METSVIRIYFGFDDIIFDAWKTHSTTNCMLMVLCVCFRKLWCMLKTLKLMKEEKKHTNSKFHIIIFVYIEYINKNM